MGKKKLQGTKESITFEEAEEFATAKLSELIAYTIAIVDELPDD